MLLTKHTVKIPENQRFLLVLRKVGLFEDPGKPTVPSTGLKMTTVWHELRVPALFQLRAVVNYRPWSYRTTTFDLNV